MDDNILICAHHEAGHALMAYIVGWSISSITLNIVDNVLQFGVTNYDFGDADMGATENLNRRILCLLSGPISQLLFEEKNEMNIDNLGPDGITIDSLLVGYTSQKKEEIIADSMRIITTLLANNVNKTAKLKVVEKLMKHKNISQEQFHNILEGFDIKRMKF
jgi:ATP-dependent Zn protease